MAMFDWVDGFRVDCPECGDAVTQWQTKDHDNLMEAVDYKTVFRMTSQCDGCGTWLTAHRKNAQGMGDFVLHQE